MGVYDYSSAAHCWEYAADGPTSGKASLRDDRTLFRGCRRPSASVVKLVSRASPCSPAAVAGATLWLELNDVRVGVGKRVEADVDGRCIDSECGC